MWRKHSKGPTSLGAPAISYRAGRAGSLLWEAMNGNVSMVFLHSAQRATGHSIVVHCRQRKKHIAACDMTDLRFGRCSGHRLADQPSDFPLIRVIRQYTESRREIGQVSALSERA
jgi:hypothetical protein